MTIRCDNCGQFISYKDIDEGKATSAYLPDSIYTKETLVWRCPKCTKKHGKPVLLVY